MVTQQQRGMSRKVTSLEQENERLRGLLSIARNRLVIVRSVLEHYAADHAAMLVDTDLRRSDPDTSTERDVTP